MRALFLCLLVTLSAWPVWADTSDSYEMEQHKRYGNCRVWTQKDMLTDETSHHLECKEETFTDETRINIIRWRQDNPGLEIRLSKGVMLHFDKYIPVAIRIDKGTVIRKSGWWSSDHMFALIDDTVLARSLMDDMAKGQRAVIMVGSERGNIRLRGSAAAIADFRGRARLGQAVHTGQ